MFPEDIYNQRKMEKIFSLIEHHCFQGHTHVPGIFTQTMNFLSPEEVNHAYRLSDEKTMINVGSVGQPRDGDPRAGFAIADIEHQTVEFWRVEYDIAAVQARMRKAKLPEVLVQRLSVGR